MPTVRVPVSCARNHTFLCSISSFLSVLRGPYWEVRLVAQVRRRLTEIVPSYRVDVKALEILVFVLSLLERVASSLEGGLVSCPATTATVNAGCGQGVGGAKLNCILVHTLTSFALQASFSLYANGKQLQRILMNQTA